MRSLLALAFAAVLFAAGVASESHSSDLLRVSEDGWYSWRVAGKEDLQINALIEAGRPQQLRIVDRGCNDDELPVTEDLGIVGADESVGWLRRFVSPRSSVSSGVLAAIAVHDNEAAAVALRDVIRLDDDRGNRKEAIFWLAQSESEIALAFLDALLSAEE